MLIAARCDRLELDDEGVMVGMTRGLVERLVGL